MTLNAFLYGLICFTIGLVVLLRGRGDSELALGRQLHWLGGHALLLSAYSWGITLVHDRIGTEPLEVDTALVLLSLVASGVVLLRFGSGLIAEAGPLPLWMNFLPVALLIPSTMLIAYAIVVVLTATEVQIAIIQWSHDLLLLPGGILAAMGFARQWRRLKQLNDVPASIILLATRRLSRQRHRRRCRSRQPANCRCSWCAVNRRPDGNLASAVDCPGRRARWGIHERFRDRAPAQDQTA